MNTESQILICEPCGCKHEEKWQNGGTTPDVVAAIVNCSFAKGGMNLGCTHATKEADFLPIDGRQILRDHMLGASRSGNIDAIYGMWKLDELYACKHYLDVLKRGIYGNFEHSHGDPTPDQILKKPDIVKLDYTDSLKQLFLILTTLAKKNPLQLSELEQFNLLFFNADKLICERIKDIASKFQAMESPVS